MAARGRVVTHKQWQRQRIGELALCAYKRPCVMIVTDVYRRLTNFLREGRIFHGWTC